MDRLLYYIQISVEIRRPRGKKIESKINVCETPHDHHVWHITLSRYILYYSKYLVTFWSYRRVWSLNGHHWWVSLHGWISQTSRFLSLCSVGGLVTESPTSIILYYYNLVLWYTMYYNQIHTKIIVIATLTWNYNCLPGRCQTTAVRWARTVRCTRGLGRCCSISEGCWVRQWIVVVVRRYIVAVVRRIVVGN